MTLKPVASGAGRAPWDAPGFIRFPDPPPEEMTAFYQVNFPGYPVSLYEHYGDRATTIITSEVAAALIPSEDYEGVRYPDLLVAFGVDPAAHRARNGYLIPEQGKPPDFVLEVASGSTARRDETVKRDNYAEMGVPEYWRFDDTGGDLYQTALAGDRLVDGEYRPIPIYRTADGGYWGRSEVLGLDLCWEDGALRFWDPAGQRYLVTHEELHAINRAAVAARRSSEAERNSERAARAEAEARADLELAARHAAEAARAAAESERNNERAARADAEARIELELAARRAAEAARAAAEAERNRERAARAAAEAERNSERAARAAAEARVRELEEELRRRAES